MIALRWALPLVIVLTSLANARTASAQLEDSDARSERPVEGETGPRILRLRANAELGFLTPLRHTIQFSNYGTRINYRTDGGQDVLFPFTRLSLLAKVRERHHITLLYQPLKLTTEAVARRNLVVDDQTFVAGTPMRFTYGFPFWRASWAYDVIRSPEQSLGFGAGLQIRNATIEFASLDGEQLVTNRDVGPVPLLRAFGRTSFKSGLFLEAEVDGFYAPIKYINGAGSDVVGAIIDSSLRAGIPLSLVGSEAFLNLRYLGGGAEGTGDDDGPGDGFNSNWLHFFILSLGARLPLL